MPLLGIAGLMAWGLATNFHPDAPALGHTDGEARTAAREQLAASGVELGDEWRELANAQAPLGLEDRFVWTEGGPEAYDQLLGRYLPVPRRVVRYAKFEGDVAERAEEFLVFVGPDGEVQRMTHRLPEGRAGAQLEEDAARSIAVAAVRTDLGLDPGSLEEVSADPSQLPDRRDWSFVFKDPVGYPLDTGEARVIVQIAGDEVVETGRFVHIPEDWEREHRKQQGVTQIVQIGCVVLTVLLFLAGAVLAVVRWSRGRFDRATFAIFFVVMAVLGAIGLGNGFRAGTAQFMTAQPWKLQVAIVLIGGLIATTGIAAVTSLLIGLAHRWLPRQTNSEPRTRHRRRASASARWCPGSARWVRLSRLRSSRRGRPLAALPTPCRCSARRWVGVIVDHRHRADVARRGRCPGGDRRLAATARRGFGPSDRSRSRGRRWRQRRDHSPLARRRWRSPASFCSPRGSWCFVTSPPWFRW